MLKRILSLACCLSLTVGLFTYRPPEAKAIVTEASLATSVLWSFMQSAGITFNGTGMNSSSWAEAIEPYLRDFTEATDSAAKSFWHWLGYDGASEFIKALSWSKITHPTTMPFPSVVIPPAAAKKMGEFTHWFAQKVGLASGGESITVSSIPGLTGQLVSICETYWSHEDPPRSSLISSEPYRLSFYSSSFDTGPYRLYCAECPIALVRMNESFKDGGRLLSPGYYLYTSEKPSYGARGLSFVHFDANKQYLTISGSSFVNSRDSYYYHVLPLSADLTAGDSDSAITATQPGALSPTYDDKGEKPTVVAYPNISGDLTSINDLLQQILDKLAANDLSSSASLEGEAAPDVPATDIGWKGTLEKIYQGIIDLPGRIAEAIKDLFIPHEGYAAEFVSGLTGAYQGRFGLLTYPFSVLGDFVGTVATLDEQEPILRWNDVKWQDHVVIAKGEYNLKSAIAGTEMQTVYQVYRTVASAALIVGFLHLCIRKLREVQSH